VSNVKNSNPDRNLALELVRVTESAALASGRFMGRNEKNNSDHAAVEAMRLMLNTIEMTGTVIIGEGEKDDAPMLFNGEIVGTGGMPAIDIAVDPIDGTRLLAMGRANALSTVAASESGSMFNPGPFVYMNKIAVGPDAKNSIDIEAPAKNNLANIARAKGCDIDDLTVVVLDRPRHKELIAELRNTRARIRLITDGDVAGSIMTAWPGSGVDVLMGIGGTPEGVLSACALRCMGGEIQGKLWSRDDNEKSLGDKMGYDLNAVLQMEDLVSSDDCFFAATGITDGELVRGVTYFGDGARTHSLVMRSKSGTVREVISKHRWDKLMRFSQIMDD
jgi:fructose-1,6-bisphosphatase II